MPMNSPISPVSPTQVHPLESDFIHMSTIPANKQARPASKQDKPREAIKQGQQANKRGQQGHSARPARPASKQPCPLKPAFKAVHQGQPVGKQSQQSQQAMPTNSPISPISSIQLHPFGLGLHPYVSQQSSQASNHGQ